MRILWWGILFALVSACASNKDKDAETKVAKLVSFDKTADMKRVWGVNTGAGKQRKFLRLLPAVVGQRVFIANDKGEVMAFAADNGKRQWRQKTGLLISGGVGAAANLVTFGTYDGQVIALDARDGTQRWQAQVSSEVLASPVTNGTIVVVQTIDARIFAFDANNGELLWRYDHLSPVLSLRGNSSPVLTATQVICAFDNGQLVSFATSDGARLWEARISQPKGRTDLERIVDVDGTPVVDGGLLYAASYQGSLVAFGRAQGNPLWKKATSTFHPLAVAGGKVFVSDERSRIVAYNTANGDIVWETEALLNRQISAPTVIGEYIAVIDKDNYLHLLTQSDGHFADRFKPSGKGFSSPMLSDNNKLYISSDSGRLSVYELAPL